MSVLANETEGELMNKDHIPNHFAANLSELDLRVCKFVPPGGNWKNLPEDFPSERVKGIRKSYSEGKGSRSTYYGRLQPSDPAYTINTYFTRPGNGCHIHYKQDRTLSFREAARIQSFPDSYEFFGSKTSVATQIGNAVPPLLAFQIAKHFDLSGGQFIDFFCGAGGMGTGFKWAGYSPVIANDVDKNFVKTYSKNVCQKIVCGDIRLKSVQEELLVAIKQNRSKKSPLLVLGGPPCQGFSTAGNRRSMDDERNWLFSDYLRMIRSIKPDAFVFENVTGILNMEGGKVFEMILEELSKTAKKVFVWRLKSENYGVPQRRERVIIVGDNTGKISELPPVRITFFQGDNTHKLKRVYGVEAALSDLPPVHPGEINAEQFYMARPKNSYQKLMRGYFSPCDYLDSLVKS